MKKMLLGLAIILVAIAIEVSVEGSLAYVTWGIAAIGMIFTILGFIDKENK